MRRTIIKESISYLTEDTKFIRLATMTMFIHSLLFTLYLLYLIARYWGDYFGDGDFSQLLEQFVETISFNTGTFIVIGIVWLFLAIGYYLLPPIGEAAMIYYLQDNEKKHMVAFAKWIYKFFPMFEYNAAISLFQLEVIWFAMLRLNNVGILESPLIVVLLIMWWLVAIFVTIFFPYARLLITIEDEDFFPAMKQSMSMAIQNMWITMQFVLVTFALSMRFIVNILIIVGIPLLLIWLGTLLWLNSFPLMQFVMSMIILGLIVLVAYVEWIIEAFFTTCRWNVYRVIKWEDIRSTEEEEE